MRNESPPLDSVHRALRLVLALRSGQVMSVTDGAEMLGVVPSTAHRLFAALCYDGFAEQDRDRRYRAGRELATRSVGSFSLSHVRRRARPHLEELNAELDETVQTWVLEGPRVRFVDGIESAQLLSVRTGGWNDVPAYCSAAGKSMLAELSAAELEHLHKGGLPPWRSSRIQTMQALKRHLSTVRQNGYADNLEEAAQGINGLAVCVKDPVGHPIMAVSVAIPSIRFHRGRIPHIAEALQATAARIEGSMTETGSDT